MKKYNSLLIAVILLTVFDQGIKIIIQQFYRRVDSTILWDYVAFRPHLNTDYSWINSMGGYGIGLMPHILVVLIILSGTLLIYGFIKSKNKDTNSVKVLFSFLFAGIICSLIDKIFWGGSLDYIALKGLFIFDLKDVYITIAETILIVMILFNRELRRVKSQQIFREIVGYCRNLINKRRTINRNNIT